MGLLIMDEYLHVDQHKQTPNKTTPLKYTEPAKSKGSFCLALETHFIL